MSTRTSKVDAGRAANRQPETQALRSLLLDGGLDEDLNRAMCFVFEGRNVAIIQPFKNSGSRVFFKDALLEHPHNLLGIQGAHTQSTMGLEWDYS